MRQTIVYYEWKEQWWLEQNSQSATIASDNTIQHGITAYSQSKHIIASVWPKVL